MKDKLLREITPLTQSDCFTVFSRVKNEFDFPLHQHEEFELNFIQNARGAKRVIGGHIEVIGDVELVLVGPNLRHGWFTHQCRSREIHEVTIQFHRDLLDEKFLQRNQASFIRNMFQQSLRGILFTRETAAAMAPRLDTLHQKTGFESVLELLSILHALSTSKDMRILSDISFQAADTVNYNSRRIEAVMAHLNKNFEREISLSEVAKLVAMSEVAFSRFFKMRTGKTFVDTLNEIRLGHASRLLIDTTQSVSEIAYRCGFNNMSNFNRIFKKKKQCTPKEFREEYTTSGVRLFV
ncbi:helix-turn-helix domain-containing protein [Flavisolibacter nicotianae]|uniref:helix-turn-helix domain-containing protein n=1 Tax=Flavisolibacter nicotianae TaxID=2364882 RepID=UPI000EB360FF|nr:AraC family transcriptional regulator [Flavisolibacter nicotianae]